MDIFEIKRSIRQAEDKIKSADKEIGFVAQLMPGRLRHVDVMTLQKLKKELKDFNAHTMTWKDD